jgi:uncharacterized protein YbjT (DUF2867 family)
VIFLAGGTGELGRRVAERLRARDVELRALVRPQSDASALEALGAEIARGDFRDPESLRRGVDGARTVITTVTAISRALGGEPAATIADVYERGNANLADAAEAAGVERFVFVSFPITPRMARAPLAAAKLATEAGLAHSSMREVIVRPGCSTRSGSPASSAWTGRPGRRRSSARARRRTLTWRSTTSPKRPSASRSPTIRRANSWPVGPRR